MKQFTRLVSVLLGLALFSRTVLSFCGFYVAKVDAKLFNRASEVVLVRDGNRTVLTMSNDFRGDPKEFAVVIPVPTLIERDQIHIGDQALIDHLAAYSAPRLVEYHDMDPCMRLMKSAPAALAGARQEGAADRRAASLGITIEARYTVGEYDIVILSAQRSNGLETWLRDAFFASHTKLPSFGLRHTIFPSIVPM